MRTSLLFGSLLLVSLTVQADETATTESGKTVILKSDGRWEYAKSSGNPATTQTSGKSYNRPATATARADLKKPGFEFFYVPDKWKPAKDEPGRLQFKHHSGDAYGLLIIERISIPLSALKKIALDNARAVAPDAKITFEEMRTVNGKKVLCLQMNGTIDSIPFSYYGYYYSNKQGVIQVLTYTSSNLLDEFKPDFEEFLAGLVPNS